MKTERFLRSGLVIAVVAVIVVVAPVLRGALAPQDDALDPMMQKWIEAGTPGEHHRHLEKMAGDWDAKATFWMEPGAEPMVTEGSMKSEMVFGGRYLVGEYSGDMMGEPFEGIAIWGYNNISHQYEGVWIDSMSTMTTTSYGTCDSAGTLFTTTVVGWDPMTGRKKQSREIVRILGDDKHTMTWFETGPDGKEFKSGEIVYTRK